MKIIYSILCLSILFVGCKTETETAPEAEAAIDVAEVFSQNSQTVLNNLKGWQNENVDYSMYAEDFVMVVGENLSSMWGGDSPALPLPLLSPSCCASFSLAGLVLPIWAYIQW